MEEQTLCSENLKFTVGKWFQFPAIFHRKDSRGFSFAENWKDESNLFADLPLLTHILVSGLGSGTSPIFWSLLWWLLDYFPPAIFFLIWIFGKISADPASIFTPQFSRKKNLETLFFTANFQSWGEFGQI